MINNIVSFEGIFVFTTFARLETRTCNYTTNDRHVVLLQHNYDDTPKLIVIESINKMHTLVLRQGRTRGVHMDNTIMEDNFRNSNVICSCMCAGGQREAMLDQTPGFLVSNSMDMTNSILRQHISIKGST